MCKLFRKFGWPIGVSLIVGLVSDARAGVAWPVVREVTGFHHKAWNSENGLGAVFDVQQSADGYLWLTTSRGVVRFDGVRFQSVEEATHGAAHYSEIDSVFLSSS